MQKYFESASSGCISLCDEPSRAKELGFVDGETFVKVDRDNWSDKLMNCLDNYDSYKRLIRASLKNVLMNHNHEKRATEFLEMLR